MYVACNNILYGIGNCLTTYYSKISFTLLYAIWLVTLQYVHRSFG